MENETLQLLTELGLSPVDWVSATKFSELTGIEVKKLNHRRRNWQENLVWTKQDGNIYYSLKGYNQWLTEQAQQRYQRACGLEEHLYKSHSCTTNNVTKSPCHTRQQQRASIQPLKLEVN